MIQETMTKEEIKKQIEILKQQIAEDEQVLQGLLEMLDELNGIEEDE